MSIGSVLNETYEYYRRSWRQYFLGSGLLFVLIGVLVALGQQARSDRDTVLTIVWWVAFTVAMIVGTAWLQAAITLTCDDQRNGRPFPSGGELLERLREHLTPVSAAALAASATFYVLAFPLYITPALVIVVLPVFLYLMTRWIVVIPIVVSERTPTRQLYRRASELAKGKVFDLLLLALMAVVLIGVVSMAVGVVVSAAPLFVRSWASTAITGAVAVPPVMIACTVCYFQLVRRGQAVRA